VVSSGFRPVFTETSALDVEAELGSSPQLINNDRFALIISQRRFMMLREDVFEQLRDAVIRGDEQTAKKLSEDIVRAGADALQVIERYLSPAIKLVGQKFETGQYFLTDLMYSAEALKSATGILTAGMRTEERERLREEKVGVVVLGTVAGDVHDIGKNILGLLLEANGFGLHDLGRDVQSIKFIEKGGEVNADIIALSALMTTTRPAQKEVIDFLKGMGLKENYIVMVGGAPTSKDWADEIGADGWAETAEEGVRLAQKILKETSS